MNNFYNEDRHSKLRRSQMITTFGPGALVNLEIGSFIAMGIDSWDDSGRQDIIYEERLQSNLRVKYFRQPPSSKNWKKGIPYRRYPRWLFCPKCRLLKTYDQWISKEDFRKFPTIPKCTGIKCFNKGLAPMSLLVACLKGHLDEFPWVSWVHRSADHACGEAPTLRYDSALSGVGLGGSLIVCTICKAVRTLEGAFTPETLDLKCNGSTPWLKDNVGGDCDQKMSTLQRGGSNVYFSNIVSSISIPPYTEQLFEKIKSNHNWAILSTSDYDISQDLKKQILTKIAEQIDRSYEEVNTCVDRMEKLSKSIIDQTEEDFRFDEYQAFHGEYEDSVIDKRNFDVELTDKGFDYSKYGLEKIFLVKSLREIRSLVGFTRIKPRDIDMKITGDDEGYEVSEMVSLTNKLDHHASWLPAIEVRGEGIFITFDQKKLDNWSHAPNIVERESIINRNLKTSCEKRHVVYKPLNSKYVLLHTISHLLIRQLSFEAGYSEASLRERIYCNSPEIQNKMQGVLIYTAAGDADGTLGGLVRQAKPERLPAILDSMMNTSRWCANDPLCIESKGQGFESLNLSACYACALLPETSCEEFNKFLDRALVAGTPNIPEIGFFKS